MMTSDAARSAISVDDVTRRFGKHVAVSDLSFSVQPGEYVGILGPNGSGKTTTLHMLIGLLEPSSGTVSLLGAPPSDAAIRRRVGIVPDDLGLPDGLTGTEFLDLHEELRQTGRSLLRDELIELLGLARHVHRPIGDWSHGMRKKVQFVAAVAHRPELLLLDEPHRGLDPEASALLGDLVRAFVAQGTTVLVATHDLLRAALTCDRVIVLHEGSQVGGGTPTELCEQTRADDLEQAFLHLTHLDSRLASARDRLDAVLAGTA